ncbi:MAG: Outer rane lipoproteinsorting protein [Chthonomonadaceae bacterium]|nr:Outer rane lipoproteinsorting protein [Chthonomonadaceae bacterium]
MVTPSTDRHRAGFRVMTAATVGAVLIALTCSSPALGQKPGDIVRNMQSLYKNAKTYHGTIKQDLRGNTQQGQAFTLSQTQVVTFSRPNRIHIHIDVTGTGAAAAMNGTSKTVVSDGKTMYQYDPKKQIYARQAAPATVTPLIGAAQAALFGLDLTKARSVSNVTVGGRSAVVIEVVPDITKVPEARRAEFLKKVKPIDLTIDATTYALLRIGAPSKPPVVELSNQVFNGSVSGSEFTFTPPPGAKLYTPPAGTKGNAAGGVSPGGPGGAP